MKKTLFVLLGFVLLSASGCRQLQMPGDFTCTTNDSAITIIDYTGHLGVVTIPNAINGMPVTSIGSNAFCACYSLTSVTLPDSVTSIEEKAFLGCTNLTSITIPSSVTNIKRSAFEECTSLTGITVNVGNPVYSSADGVLFNTNQAKLIQCPTGKAGSYMIPSGVTCIGENAFDRCTRLTNITIPDSVTLIGNRAFNFCTRLTSITIPDGVTSIGRQAFFSCDSLTNITIPDVSIDKQTFENCSNLTYITIGSTSIWDNAFMSCSNSYPSLGNGIRGAWDPRVPGIREAGPKNNK